MTEQEAIEFVTTEIKTRYRTLNDTQFGDWVTVAARVDYARARQAVRELSTSPTATLTVKAFAARLNLGPAWHKPVAPVIRYDPYVRCLEAPPAHPDWEDKQWFRTEEFERSNDGDERYVSEYARAIAADIQEREGGRWCGIAIPRGETAVPRRDPQVRLTAEAYILNGPDGPGRRWLLARQAAKEGRGNLAVLAQSLKALPAGKPPKTVASRAELDAVGKPGPARIDWGSPDLTPLPESPREPGQEG